MQFHSPLSTKETERSPVLRAAAVSIAIIGAMSLGISSAYAQTDLPNITIIATGGTIANTPDGRLAVEAVVEQVPQVLEVADLNIVDVTRVGSSSLTFQEFIDTAKAIERVLAEDPDVDGIVVTIGSNTSEDMAWFLNLVIDSDIPIIVTAAQRQRTTLSEDSSRNFLDAVRTAVSPDASGRGVLMVVNEEIHAAREVTKVVVSRVDSWQSFNLGVVGLISAGNAYFYRSPERRHTTSSEFSLDGITTIDDLPKVDIIYTYVSAGPELIEAAVAAGAEGIVIATYLTGSPHVGQRPAIMAAAESGIAVVYSTRGIEGRVNGNGDPIIGGDTLSPQKAHILLMLALTVTDDPAEIQRIFNEY